MPVDFTAIDFETANASSASACAVGMARVRDGRIVATAGWLIKPPAGHDAFFAVNIGIHGIHPDDVAGAKTWAEQLPDITAFTGSDVLVAHNAGFDTTVMRRACEATSAPCPRLRYLCSLQIARKAYDLPSYRLPLAAAAAGFTEFTHHEPTADAVACAHIVIDAARRIGAVDTVTLAEGYHVQLREIGAGPMPADPVFRAA